ncbi:MAG: hypothetical protein DRP45_05725 [Candidatus Zixiibacteriota bacterium]|nr:MAG: hypothetical protein DRP45_05725 [candidate division Zixibacteria bacterium]
MAADEDKTTVEVPENAEGDGAKKKGGPSIIMLGGIAVGAIVIGVVLALFVIAPMMSGSDGGDEEQAEITEQQGESDSHGKSKDAKKKKDDGHGGGGGESLVYAIKDIVVNPAGTGGTRFLSCSIAFELGSSELVAEFEARELLVRDALITILSSKTVAELTNVRQKEIVRYMVKKRVSQLLDTEEIEAVYYTDFVLQ